jgi:hypothetical protein
MFLTFNSFNHYKVINMNFIIQKEKTFANYFQYCLLKKSCVCRQCENCWQLIDFQRGGIIGMKNNELSFNHNADCVGSDVIILLDY